MAKPALFKTTFTIWSEYNPNTVELSDLARDAEQGESICSSSDIVEVLDPEQDPDCDEGVLSFFNMLDED